MRVVNAGVEAGSSLVAPQRAGVVVQSMREGTVEELEEFVPLGREVLPCGLTTKAYSIMDDVLYRKTVRLQ